MKRSMGWILGLGAASALAACASPSNVDEVQQALSAKASAGTPFGQALFQEYQAYTRQQVAKEVEWVDATHSARKALRANASEIVAPDEVSSRPLSSTAVPELTAARARLMGYLDGGANQRVPAAAAKAQVAFDCWLEQESQAQITAAKTCRTTFLTHEPMLKKAVGITQAADDTAARNFVVGFSSGSAQLSAQANQTLKDVATAQAQMRAPLVSVTGFADTVGSADSNLRLARHRADAVSAQLTALGVNPSIISENALGETHLSHQTGDGVDDAKNRRVEIVLAGGGWMIRGGYGGYAYGGNGYGYGYGYGYGWGQGHHGGSYAVFFTPGSSKLNADAVEELKRVVAAQKVLKPKTVRIIGFTDRTGSAATNARLSNERAQVVAGELNSLGGTATSTESRSGENWGFAYGGPAYGGLGHDSLARRVEILFGY